MLPGTPVRGLASGIQKPLYPLIRSSISFSLWPEQSPPAPVAALHPYKEARWAGGIQVSGGSSATFRGRLPGTVKWEVRGSLVGGSWDLGGTGRTLASTDLVSSRCQVLPRR